MVTFDHEKLEVYQLAVEYTDLAEEIAPELEPGHAHVRDELRRASDSIVNNTAEGAGEFNPPEKARFYRMALRSGTESAASLHTCLRRRLANEQKVQAARNKLKRVVEMLTRLIKSMNARRAA
jgi:four helix bundle protein